MIQGALLSAADAWRDHETISAAKTSTARSAYKLRVSQKDGTVYTYYLDPDVFLEIKVLERRNVRGSEQETKADLADYELVNWRLFPVLHHLRAAQFRGHRTSR